MAARNNFALFFQKPSAGAIDIIRLPVNPEKLPVSQDSANEEYNVPVSYTHLPLCRFLHCGAEKQRDFCDKRKK